MAVSFIFRTAGFTGCQLKSKCFFLVVVVVVVVVVVAKQLQPQPFKKSFSFFSEAAVLTARFAGKKVLPACGEAALAGGNLPLKKANAFFLEVGWLENNIDRKSVV